MILITVRQTIRVFYKLDKLIPFCIEIHVFVPQIKQKFYKTIALRMSSN